MEQIGRISIIEAVYEENAGTCVGLIYKSGIE